MRNINIVAIANIILYRESKVTLRVISNLNDKSIIIKYRLNLDDLK